MFPSYLFKLALHFFSDYIYNLLVVIYKLGVVYWKEQWLRFLNPRFGFCDSEALVKLFHVSEPRYLPLLK